jgi:prepilin-type N-terminal cleavage/methylation domain-containing protein
MSRFTRRGSTLIELIVTVALLGIVASVAAVALRLPSLDDAAGLSARVKTARRQAIESGRAIWFEVPLKPGESDGTAYPDGRVLIADSSVEVDPMTGRIVEPE